MRDINLIETCEVMDDVIRLMDKEEWRLRELDSIAADMSFVLKYIPRAFSNVGKELFDMIDDLPRRYREGNIQCDFQNTWVTYPDRDREKMYNRARLIKYVCSAA